MWRSDAKLGSSRQRPVSCHFCRTRKLRCSRQFPCPNCTTRGINCQLHTSQVLPVNTRYSKEDERNDREDLSNSALLARLRKLEDIVMRTGGHNASEVAGVGRVPPVQTHLHTQQHRTESAAAAESDRLERECMFQDSSSAICPDMIVFRTCPIHQITKGASYIFLSPAGPFSPGEPTKCIWLPQREEATVLLEKYLNEITYIHHVVHLPSTRILIGTLYDDLSRQADIRPGNIALLLSILASSTFSWNIQDPDYIFSSVDEADRQSASWVKATLDVLEYSRRTTSGTLEDVQAMIILSFVVCSLEGMSSRYRNLIGTAILLARELLLHRTDHPSNSAMIALPQPDSVQAEIGRRVWWYLVATDWMLSGYIGPQEGLYAINPNHMAVRIPRNIDDEDLVDGMASMEFPLTQPTSMSYFLQRIRLAHICREFTDQVPFSGSDPEEISYHHVLEVDAKLVKFMGELPPYFRLDGASLGELVPVDSKTAPGIITQKYIFHSLINARRCKLHLHYMVRGTTDPTYARSREMCLQAARMIIKIERLLETEDLPFVLTRLKSCGLIYCIVMAIIVLLLDICFHKDAVNTELRKAEIVDACSILEEARGQSAMAEKLLDSLMSILPKHQVSLPALNGPRKDGPVHLTRETGPVGRPSTSEANIDQRNSNLQIQGPADAEVSYFEEIWQSFNGDMDTLDWNGFLSDLDSRFSTGQA